MADTGVYCTTAQVSAKAGLNASTTSVTEAYINAYVVLAEGVVNATCRKVFATTSGAFAALPAGGRTMLSDAVSSLAAMYVISYDQSGFTSRAEAATMLNILRDSYARDIAELKDMKVQEFIMQGS